MADWADNYHEYLYKDVETVTYEFQSPVPLQFIEIKFVLEKGDEDGELQPSGGVLSDKGERSRRAGRTRDLFPEEHIS